MTTKPCDTRIVSVPDDLTDAERAVLDNVDSSEQYWGIQATRVKSGVLMIQAWSLSEHFFRMYLCDTFAHVPDIQAHHAELLAAERAEHGETARAGFGIEVWVARKRGHFYMPVEKEWME